jgi:hypothetical protein
MEGKILSLTARTNREMIVPYRKETAAAKPGLPESVCQFILRLVNLFDFSWLKHSAGQVRPEG